MKRLFFLPLLSLLLFAGCSDDTPAVPDDDNPPVIGGGTPSVYSYSLPGKGTSDEPYKIATKEDFDTFISELYKDPARGRGYVFLQTSPIKLSGDGNAAPSSSDHPRPDFCGTYYGGHNYLSGFRYEGHRNSSTDVRIGLFGTISGATITDLFIKDFKINGIYEMAGCLAGYADKSSKITSVTVEDVTVEGQTGSIGGLVGMMNGDLNFSGVKVKSLSVKSDGVTGGMIGIMCKGDLRIDGMSYPDGKDKFTISGGTGVGGFVGSATGGSIIGPNVYDMSKSVPSRNSFKPMASGVITATDKAGGVVGTAAAGVKITGMTSDSRITVKGGYCAGIVAETFSDVSSCAFNGELYGGEYMAGILAYTDGTVSISHCINYADLNGGKYQGGIASYITLNRVGHQKSNVEWCINSGNLNAGKNVGGIVSIYDPYYKTNQTPAPSSTLIIELHHCANYGYIKARGTGDYAVGGIVGYLKSQYAGHIWACANHGPVTSEEVQLTMGGVVGMAGCSPEPDGDKYIVEKCMNSAVISCDKKSTKLGGIVGHGKCGFSNETAIIRDCYNTGSISVDQKDDTGGILGFAGHDTHTYHNFNRGKIAHGNAIVGTHSSGSKIFHHENYYIEGTGGSWPSSTKLSASDITNKDKFEGFDFENVWEMTSDGPVLRDCHFQSVKI